MAPAHTYQIHYVCLISPLIGCAYSGIPSSPPSADYFISAYLVFFRFLTMHSFDLRFQRVRVIVYSLVMLWNCIHSYSSTTSCRHVTHWSTGLRCHSPAYPVCTLVFPPRRLLSADLLCCSTLQSMHIFPMQLFLAACALDICVPINMRQR